MSSGAPIGPLTTLGLGGPAGQIIEADTDEAVIAAVDDAARDDVPVLILGGGSNVVVADEGFAGTVVCVRTQGVTPRRVGERMHVRVAAGVPWGDVVAYAVDAGLAGIECLAGIPGSTGATPIQNVGAYGQDVAQTLVDVTVYDRQTREVVVMAASDCGLAYRASTFRGSDRWIVLAVTFALHTETALSRPIAYRELAAALNVGVGEKAPLPETRDAVLALRRGKGMVLDADDPDTRSAGSFFTNPILSAAAFGDLVGRSRTALGPDVQPPGFPEADGRVKTSAAWLIDHAGFGRGTRRGPVGQSSKHALALVAAPGATTNELVALAREIAAAVQERFGVALQPEPVFVGHRW